MKNSNADGLYLDRSGGAAACPGVAGCADEAEHLAALTASRSRAIGVKRREVSATVENSFPASAQQGPGSPTSFQPTENRGPSERRGSEAERSEGPKMCTVVPVPCDSSQRDGAEELWRTPGRAFDGEEVAACVVAAAEGRWASPAAAAGGATFWSAGAMVSLTLDVSGCCETVGRGRWMGRRTLADGRLCVAAQDLGAGRAGEPCGAGPRGRPSAHEAGEARAPPERSGRRCT